MDVYDRVQAEDLMKNAVIIASFVYHAANRDDAAAAQAAAPARGDSGRDRHAMAHRAAWPRR